MGNKTAIKRGQLASPGRGECQKVCICQAGRLTNALDLDRGAFQDLEIVRPELMIPAGAQRPK